MFFAMKATLAGLALGGAALLAGCYSHHDYGRGYDGCRDVRYSTDVRYYDRSRFEGRHHREYRRDRHRSHHRDWRHCD